MFVGIRNVYEIKKKTVRASIARKISMFFFLFFVLSVQGIFV